MKRMILIAAAALCIAGCGASEEAKVMARYVPERSDDFVFENNLVCGRIYGKALEGNPTSPGIDVWVKLPGKLVANEWYRHFSEEGSEDYYHHDHGGKDCYKVATSLGAGASALVAGGSIMYPKTNYRSWNIVEEGPEKVVFTLHYPEWEASENFKIALDKTITVVPDTYFLKCEDVYTFSGAPDSLYAAAGVFRHAALNTIEQEYKGTDRYAIWEKASDQSHEAEDGRLGVGVYVPGAEAVGYSAGEDHGLVMKKIVSGEPFVYYFGSCWSKGDVKSDADWFEIVKGLK